MSNITIKIWVLHHTIPIAQFSLLTVNLVFWKDESQMWNCFWVITSVKKKSACLFQYLYSNI